MTFKGKRLNKIIHLVMSVMCLFSFCVPFSIHTKTADATGLVPTEAVRVLIRDYALQDNPSLTWEEADSISQGIVYHSYYYGVNPLLVSALIHTESRFRPSVTSGAGAIGLGQLMPGTAHALGVDPWDVMGNIQGACSYLATQINNFANTGSPTENALAAYNAGPGAVWQYGGVPPYRETINYVSSVGDAYNTLYRTLQARLGLG